MNMTLAKKGIILSIVAVMLIIANLNSLQAKTKALHLSLQTRDPETSKVITKTEDIDVSKVAIVIIDTWNYHWCMTWTEQAGGMTPRMNRVNEGVRKLGIQIIWAPTDVASLYSGWMQRQRAMAVPYIDVPKIRDKSCNFSVPRGKCLCGPGIDCKVNLGEEAMDPELLIANQDLIVSGTQELYSICKAQGINHLIYFGGATNICLTGKPEGLGPMFNAGLNTYFARDLAFAWTTYDPSKGYTPTTGNTQATDDLERGDIPTLSIVDELRKEGLWNDKWVTEPVRVTPAGTINRPYFFEKQVTVSLEIPLVKGAEIRYTLDGSEPKPSSKKYDKPLNIQGTTTLRTAAFIKGERVSAPNKINYFVHLPDVPAKPDITLDQLIAEKDLYAVVSDAAASFLWHPVVNRSYEEKTLSIRNIKYTNGLGMHATAYMRYKIKPEWKRFVALAGVDDNLLENFSGVKIARFCKVVFKVFIDGKLAAESPVMRISQEPWRFDVPVPEGSQKIVLVCDDMGDRSHYNLGDWVGCRFLNKIGFMNLYLSLSLFVVAQIAILNAYSQQNKVEATLPFSMTFSKNKQSPVDIPVVPALSQGKPYFDEAFQMILKRPGKDDYQPSGDGAFVKKNGKSERIYSITTGVWRLLVGDRPIVGIDQRSLGGAYARPGLMPYLGVKGKITLKVSDGKTKKNLEDFTNITSILAAGEPKWICEDDQLKLKVTLTAYPFLEEFGCALTAMVESQNQQKPELEWHYDGANYVKDYQDYAEFAFDKYTRIFVGSRGHNSAVRQGVLYRTMEIKQGKPCTDTLLCVWGYKDYDRAEIDSAYERLRFRPFPSKEWTAQMKKNWFNHWIGRGLEPEEKFLNIFQMPEPAISQSKDFWGAMRNRVRVKTGDARFDNVVQSIGSRLISDYEYPGYLHGSNYMKYGKINCGMYGHEAAGFHNEVATSLKFISGTQCVKGRQRYIMPNFRISEWAEEMNPYFIDQVWYHYRWTGDLEFLNDMWPSVRRALEHLIATSDPEHDGIFTGFYETWNGDAKNRGGEGSTWTAMGISALRNGFKMATILRDVDWTFPGQQNPNPPADNDFSKRYKRLLDKSEAAYESLYNKKIGSYSSGEWNGPLRNMPDNEESNYAIWREIGSLLENYTSMRFIRENYHQNTENGIFEFCNKNWPVCWSNHYASFSDAMSSVASAAMANDMNNYWPVLKSVSEGVYTKPECTVIAGGGSQLSLESDQMLMMAILDNIFGLKPYFGENLLIVRPSFPDAWKNPEIELPDVSYKYFTGSNEISLTVKTPVDRILQAEIPTRQSVREVMVNGHKVDYQIKKEVNYCRVVIKSAASKETNIKVLLDEKKVTIPGDVNCTVNGSTTFNIRNAELVRIHNPQIDFGQVNVKFNTIQVTPKMTGKYTLFAELKNGNAFWYEPLELTVKDPWSIEKQYQAWNTGIPAKLLSPIVNREKQALEFQIANNCKTNQAGEMTVEIFGKSIKLKVKLVAGQVNKIEVPIKDIRSHFSPGTVPFKVIFQDIKKSGHAIDWNPENNDSLKKNVLSLDIRKYNNINLEKLYGNDNFLTWRNDYTGAAVGIDWRDKLEMDGLGYRLFTQPISLVNWGTLPEHYYYCSRWIMPRLPDNLNLPISFPFVEKGTGVKNILALINAENSQSLPGEALIDLEHPVSAEKIYLLTANLTKTCKSYYPAAEVEIDYDSGENQVVQLIPPFNMPSFVQAYCPEALHLQLGKLETTQTFGKYGNDTGIALTDLVTDSKRKIRQLKLRCVSSETVFGIIGISLLSKN